jgi:hypothetical protein
VLARLKRVDARTLRGYLTQHWRKKAPKKWLKAWDAERDDGQAPLAPKGRTKK